MKNKNIEGLIYEPQLFTICIDENGYYKTGNDGILVQVKEMPSITNISQLFAYRYNEETMSLEVDENKLAEINYQLANPPLEINEKERLADLENAFIELSSMILGGV